MTNPLGYYTSHTPGDSGLLADMEQAWGSTFEKLNDTERAWMIYQLGYQLWQLGEVAVRDEVFDAVQLAAYKSKLSVSDKLGLIQALVEQLKSS